ncbi:glycosyl transferase family 4 [Maribacter vaceletii]|uniref:Glycosyl transferase family 4 n=1 Tax=Maribacter vaceletii TaxID=1206816 RepID=A0A495E9F7_9FLAO|nr:glycosyltransferase family 4 protein [Maribacter vaceletii]RKR13321.1 glycosyl transferase family 4 [Maribacter vaceletii]
MKKVLIIAYYWPPAGGPGVQRWLKFITYLRDFNIEPVLYIPENPHYPIQDTSLLKEIPEGIFIYKKPIFEPYKLAGIFSSKKTNRISSGLIQTKKQSFLEKAFLWVRGNLFIPDARKFWVEPSISFLEDVIKKEKIETIITTGPPHSVHLIGLGLKKKLNITWISDFRDPWTTIGYHKKLKLTEASKRKHKLLESKVLNSADKIIVTSATTKNVFKAITKQPIEVITNGYDIQIANDVALDSKFTIAHIGSLLTGRDPNVLWQALSELLIENADFKKLFSLQLVGVVSDDVLENIKKYSIHNNTEIVGYLSHNNAISFQRKSQVLLLIEINSEETKGIIPGKVFEYLAAKRPILGVGPKDWEVGQLIKETNAGEAFTYDSKEKLKEIILKWFNLYLVNKLKSTSNSIEKYSRKALTEQLAKHL